jgi:hypothetical protein
VDVADIPFIIIVGHVEGGWSARGSEVATHVGGGATQNHSLSVLLITKGLKIIFCLFVGYEENQAQELSVDAARGRHARRRECVLFIGTQFSNLYTAVDTPARGRVGCAKKPHACCGDLCHDNYGSCQQLHSQGCGPGCLGCRAGLESANSDLCL